MIALIIELTPASESVCPNPAARLKCEGSIPIAANPVIAPFAPPEITAAAIPRSQISAFAMQPLCISKCAVGVHCGVSSGVPVAEW